MPYRAIDSGATFIAEAFLFTIGAGLILAESMRSSRSTSKRRDAVDDELAELNSKVEDISSDLLAMVNVWEERWTEERQRLVIDINRVKIYLICGLYRNDELTRILEKLVEIGLHGGFSGLGAGDTDSPLRIPKISLLPARKDDSGPSRQSNQTNSHVNTPEDSGPHNTSSSEPEEPIK